MKIRLATKEIIYDGTGRDYAIYLEEGLGNEPIEVIDWVALGFPNYIEPTPKENQKVTDNLIPINNITYTFEVVDMTTDEIAEARAEVLRSELWDLKKQFAADTMVWFIKRELASGRILLADLPAELKTAYTRINEIEVKLGI